MTILIAAIAIIGITILIFCIKALTGYDSEGYDRHGYNRAGYDREGYNRRGYNRAGYDREGYNRRGFNKKNKHRDTHSYFDPYGYNSDGFDEDGEHMDYAHLKGRRLSVVDNGVAQVDLHGMSVRAAVQYVEDVLDYQLPPYTKQLVLIHGYHRGTRLKSLVRSLDHPRIERILDDLYNEGMTVYVLK